jgi:Na+-transporting NADH:ubiquinone oxidoreductase subunit C
MSDEEVTRLYTETVVADVVKSSGDIVETEEASVDVFKEYKKPKDVRNLPVYTIYGTKEKKNVVSYVFPVYGKGLWDFIWGYVAVKSDLETVSGVVFDHKGETPGLGARITDAEVQSRFKGKKIVDANGEMSIPYFEKGEGNDYSNMPQQVDGLSGATITAKGVSSMLESYLLLYKPFILSHKK